MRRFFLLAAFCALCASACAQKSQIALENLPKAAPLNAPAVSGVVEPAVNDAAFFRAEGVFQIEADFSFLGEVGLVAAGFLQDGDFDGKRLRLPLSSERAESALFFSDGAHQDAKRYSFRSQKFSQNFGAKGFYIRSTAPIKIERIAAIPRDSGENSDFFLNNADGARFYNLENCGKLDASQEILRLSNPLAESDAVEIFFSAGGKSPVALQFGGKKFAVHLSESKSSVVFPKAVLGDFDKNSRLFVRKDEMKFILQAKKRSLREFWQEGARKKAIPVDPGLILAWPRSFWRDEDCEIFCSHFGSSGEVVFLDFCNYAVQDDYLKRLAFFSEKTGWRGKIPSVEEVARLHAFNAHDYKSEVLARFFNLAREQKIPLTEGEAALAEILVANGVLFFDGERFLPDEKKALVSISQESAAWTRRILLTHEGFHGIYFFDGEFRACVERAFEAADKKSKEFLLNYFRANPSLDYDVSDEYLMKNEFMAYILQSPLSGKDSVQNYFVGRLAASKNINRLFPESAEYLRQTDAKAFLQAAQEISAFLRPKYGLESGRICRVECE